MNAILPFVCKGALIAYRTNTAYRAYQAICGIFRNIVQRMLSVTETTFRGHCDNW